MCLNNEELISLKMFNEEAFLILKTPPEQRFRYRYHTEMSETHGSLSGIKPGYEKCVPEVELVNFLGEALIRVSLVTCNESGDRYPHPHNLFIRKKLYHNEIYENLHNKSLTKTGHYSDPHFIRVGQIGDDYVASFQGMCIINSKKEDFAASMMKKLQLREKEQGKKPIRKEVIHAKVTHAVKLVDPDFVSLCFEAFREEDGHLVPICAPLYSEPIGNAKSANTGKLKISKINKCYGSCKGGDEIWLLVEKINKKGLTIRFFEEFDGKIVWEHCIEGDDMILHHQYAIIFKTPPYRDLNISTEAKVLLRLERQLAQACDFSQSITFVYEPHKKKNDRSKNIGKKRSLFSQTKHIHVKRPRVDSSNGSGISSQHKKRKRRDDQECSNVFCDDADMSDLDHFLSDNGLETSETSQTCQKFNAEDFMQFLSDDCDEVLQKDGVSSTAKIRRDLIQIFHLLYSKLDESEVKKLTDQINSIKFSKGKSKVEVSSEEKNIQDAVSTLLSLREKAVEIDSLKKCDTLNDAVLQNKWETVRRILGSLLDCSSLQDHDLNTPLHSSLLLRHDHCTEALLDYLGEMCHNINLKNKEGKTALHIAAAMGNLRHVQLLLRCGANVNEIETKTKRNILHIAVLEKNIDLAEYLIKNTNINVQALDADGKTPSSLVQLLSPPVKFQFERLFSRKESAKGKIGNTEFDKSNSSEQEINVDKLQDPLNQTGSLRTLAEIWNALITLRPLRKSEILQKAFSAAHSK